MIYQKWRDVLAIVGVDYTVPVKEIGQELQINHESSIKYQLHQYFYADIGAKQVVFCDWLLQIQT